MSKDVVIGFGVLFAEKRKPREIDVVIEVGEGDWFGTVRTRLTQKGKKAICGIGGTAGVDDLAEIMGRWTTDEVITAAKIDWFERMNRRLPADLEQIFRENSLKPDRVVTID